MCTTKTSRSVCGRLVTMIALLLGAAGPARAACPAVGSVQLTYKDASAALPAAPDEYLMLVSDECLDTMPPATMVTGKVQLENRASTPQTVECTMGTDRAWDYSRITVPAMGSVVLTLIATNWSGGLSGQNVTNFGCRNTSVDGDGDGNVSASWVKLVTESVVEAIVPLSPEP